MVWKIEHRIAFEVARLDRPETQFPEASPQGRRVSSLQLDLGFVVATHAR
jgi:hypothetical protein